MSAEFAASRRPTCPPHGAPARVCQSVLLTHEANLKGEIHRAFEKLGANVAEVKPDNMAGAVNARLAQAFAGNYV